MSFHKLREWLSEQEHIQWEHWSKALAEELILIRDRISDSHTNPEHTVDMINNRLERWKKNWKPYKKLKEEIKDYDREWADKILDNLPFKCPVYQCGGLMVCKERKVPKDFDKGENYPDGYDGDEKTPDLVCSNCKAVYQFWGISKKRTKLKDVN
jgi:hypothetical protein